MRNKWLIGTGIAVLSVLFSVSVAYAALTFTATAVTSDGALTLTTGAASTAVTVTYGISANAATTTDSLYVGGLAQHTGATASATALVLGSDVSLYRSAANFLTIGQAGLGIPTATASGTGLVIGGDVTLFRSAANTLKIQGNLANATTTDSLYVGGLAQLTGATASATALVIGGDIPIYRLFANSLAVVAGQQLLASTASATALTIGGDVPLFRSAANTLKIQGNLANATTTDSLYVGGVLQHTAGTASATALVIGGDVPLFRNAANQLRLQGTLSVSAGVTPNAATTTDSLYVGGVLQHTAGTASATALVIGNDVPLFRNAANQLRLQGTLSVSDGVTPNAATTTDSLRVGGIAQIVSFTSLATTSATTTRSLLVGAPAGTATTTLSFGNVSGSKGNCIEMSREGTSYRMFLTASSGMQTVAGVGLQVEAGSCRD